MRPLAQEWSYAYRLGPFCVDTRLPDVRIFCVCPFYFYGAKYARLVHVSLCLDTLAVETYAFAGSPPVYLCGKLV